MPTPARIFISTVIGVGAVTLVTALLRPWGTEPARFACLMLLALAGGSLKVRLPGITGNISLSFVFVLLGIAVLTLPQTLAIACAATVAQCLCHTTRRQRAVQVSFNVAVVVISAAIAYQGPRLLIPPDTMSSFVVALILAAILYFVSNTLLVSTVLALLEGGSIRSLWMQCHLWSFPYYILGTAVVGLAAVSMRAIGWQRSLLVLPAMYLVYLAYGYTVARLAPSAIQDA